MIQAFYKPVFLTVRSLLKSRNIAVIATVQSLVVYLGLNLSSTYFILLFSALMSAFPSYMAVSSLITSLIFKMIIPHGG